MAITKETEIAKIEVVGEYKAVQVELILLLKKMVTKYLTPHRHVVHPDMDISGEDAEVQAVANAVWTDSVKAAWKTFQENNRCLMSYIGQGLPADTFQGFTTDSFTGDGSATTFTLSKEPFSEDTLIVVINNVIQKPTTNFTVSGTTLTIVGTAVADGDVIYAIHTGGPLPIGEANKLDLNGASDQLILDADGDTTISADTDDQVDIKIGGTDRCHSLQQLLQQRLLLVVMKTH